jgi:hypothetical protein
MFPTKFRFIWTSGFRREESLEINHRREESLEINQSETRIACGDHVCKRIGMK